MSTYVPKKNDVIPKWYLVDAEGQALGRVATCVATLLRGKHRPTFTPYLDTGDHVIVLNATKIRWTGKKLEQKVYRHYTGYPGGVREKSARRSWDENPSDAVREAVFGMLPKNKLRDRMTNRLLVYRDTKHPHQAQQPEAYKMAAAKI
ncbi:MAG: 50S ribosomal protein L13 [Acidobacteria bacterium]|nr:50S ribosomal protein L13 [Acidobacteriota bacterium]